MKINPDSSAFPGVSKRLVAGQIEETWHRGLTIREHFAAMAMRGILGNDGWMAHISGTASDPDCASATVALNAVRYADALIAELNK